MFTATPAAGSISDAVRAYCAADGDVMRLRVALAEAELTHALAEAGAVCA